MSLMLSLRRECLAILSLYFRLTTEVLFLIPQAEIMLGQTISRFVAESIQYGKVELGAQLLSGLGKKVISCRTRLEASQSAHCCMVLIGCPPFAQSRVSPTAHHVVSS